MTIKVSSFVPILRKSFFSFVIKNVFGTKQDFFQISSKFLEKKVIFYFVQSTNTESIFLTKILRNLKKTSFCPKTFLTTNENFSPEQEQMRVFLLWLLRYCKFYPRDFSYIPRKNRLNCIFQSTPYGGLHSTPDVYIRKSKLFEFGAQFFFKLHHNFLRLI